MILPFIFAILFAIKGGSGNIFTNWNHVRQKNKLLNFLLDGKVLSTILVWIVITAWTADAILAVKIALAWLIAVAPSMGEEHGAIGRIGHAWGPYVQWMPTLERKELFGCLFTYREGRMYGFKKALQRAVWIGAALTVATGYTPFILFALCCYVPAVFIGQQFNWMIFKSDGWTLAEPLIGLLVIGIPMALYIQGI